MGVVDYSENMIDIRTVDGDALTVTINPVHVVFWHNNPLDISTSADSRRIITREDAVALRDWLDAVLDNSDI